MAYKKRAWRNIKYCQFLCKLSPMQAGKCDMAYKIVILYKIAELKSLERPVHYPVEGIASMVFSSFSSCAFYFTDPTLDACS